MEPVLCLVYGRRREFIGNPGLTKQMEFFRSEWLQWSTYDRLHPEATARNWVSVRITPNGWQVIAVPPTLTMRDTWEDDL